MMHSGSFITQRGAEEIYDLLVDPTMFAPLLPDYESMELHDASSFKLRTVISVGQINGHANLEMALTESVRPSHVTYRGEGIVAGSTIRFGIAFTLVPADSETEVQWQGEVAVEGMLAFLAGSVIDSKSRADFERMAERIKVQLASGRSSDAALPAHSESCPEQ